MYRRFRVTHERADRRATRDLPDAHQAVVATADDHPERRIDGDTADAALMAHVSHTLGAVRTRLELTRRQHLNMTVPEPESRYSSRTIERQSGHTEIRSSARDAIINLPEL